MTSKELSTGLQWGFNGIYPLNSQNYGHIHHSLHGKVLSFDWAIFDSHVSLPEGNGVIWSMGLNPLEG